MPGNFIPLLYITANTDDQSLASCFEAGGDDLIIRPVGEILLYARVNALLKMGGMYQRELKERKELAYYHSMMEAEQRMTKSIFSSIVHQDHLDTDHIQYTLSPMSILNGDMLLAASTPDGHEYVLLGDFTGHGLTASVGTLPASEIFYAMTAKGFGLDVIIGEINRRLRLLLPLGMFMATCAVDIDPQANTLCIWAGGVPDLLLRRAKDGTLISIRAKNLPLGIVDSPELGLAMEHYFLQPGDRFYIYTDGVTETEDAQGQMFGASALQQVVAEAGHGDNVFNAIMQALEVFRAGHEQSDDITLLEYTYTTDQKNTLPEKSLISRQSVNVNAQWELNLKLDLEAIRKFDPRPLLTQLVIDVQGLYSYRRRLYSILSELFNNAVEHGLLKMQTVSMQSDGDVTFHRQQRQLRLDQLEDGHIWIYLKNVPNDNQGGVIYITVEDSGNGFDYSAYQDGSAGKAESGLHRVRLMADDVQFSSPGNRVTTSCTWFFANS